MFLFAILLGIMLLLIAFVFVVTVGGGAIFTLVFGDVIVCIVLLGLLIWFLFFRKK